MCVIISQSVLTDLCCCVSEVEEGVRLSLHAHRAFARARAQTELNHDCLLSTQVTLNSLTNLTRNEVTLLHSPHTTRYSFGIVANTVHIICGQGIFDTYMAFINTATVGVNERERMKPALKLLAAIYLDLLHLPLCWPRTSIAMTAPDRRLSLIRALRQRS